MKHRMMAVDLNGYAFPVIGNVGKCVVVEETSIPLVECEKLGVYLIELCNDDTHRIRIRCVCAEHGAGTTYCCIKCRKILHDWSPIHTSDECGLSVVENVMGL